MIANRTMAKIGHCHVDFSKNSIHINEQVHTLPAKVMRVLFILAEQAGHTVTRESFIEQVWLGNTAVGEKGLTNYIWKIRKTLEIADPEITAIDAISKVGYSLALPVEWLADESIANSQSATFFQKSNFSVKRLALPLTALVILVLCLFLFLPKGQYQNQYKLTDLPGIEDYPVISRDGTKFLYGWAKAGSRGQIFSRELNVNDNAASQKVSEQLTTGAEIKLSPAWSPTGDRIAYIQVSKHRCDVVLQAVSTSNGQAKNSLKAPKIIAHCHFGGNAYRTLSWSGDGKQIAYVGKIAAESATAIFSYNLENESVSQLTFPKASEFDSLPSWDANGEKLLFTRSQGIGSAHIFLWQAGNEVKQLTDAALPTFALAWDENDEDILFISYAQGLYELSQMASDGSKRQALYRDQAITNFSPLFDGKGSIALAIRNTREYTQIWQMDQWQTPLHEFQSSGRELYGDFSPQTNKLLTLSNRRGGFQLWLGTTDGSENKQLTELNVIPGIPDWSPTGEEYVYAVERDGGKQSDLVIGQLGGKSEIIVQPISYLKNVAFAPDGQQILFSSNQTGQWQIWVYDRVTDSSKQITYQGGVYGRMSHDGQSLFFTKPEQSGLWQLNLASGESQLIIEQLAAEDWGNWDISTEGIIYLARAEKQDEIHLLTVSSTNQESTDTIVKKLRRGEVRKDRSLRVRDNTLTLNLRQRVQGDIIVIEKS